MKEEFEEEFIEEFIEEFDDVVEEENEVELLPEEEEEETSGGSFKRQARCLGTITNTSRMPSVWLGILNRGIIRIKKVIPLSGVKCTWKGTSANFLVSRKSSTLGTSKIRVYGADGDWINCIINWR